MLVFSPPHQSTRFHAENHKARNQEQGHHILLTHLCCVSLADLHYPHKRGELFRGTTFLVCPATTKPSGRAESASDIFGTQGEGKRHQCTSALGIAGGMGYRVLPSQVWGEEAALPLKSFCASLWFLSFLAWGGREKERRRSHQATCLATVPNKRPARARSPSTQKIQVFATVLRGLPLRSEGMPAAVTVQRDK